MQEFHLSDEFIRLEQSNQPLGTKSPTPSPDQ